MTLFHSSLCIGLLIIGTFLVKSEAWVLLLASPLTTGLSCRSTGTTVRASQMSSSKDTAQETADRFREQARILRQEVEAAAASKGVTSTPPVSPWSLPPCDSAHCPEYRLYLNIGREEGTWMDRRWGASENRIEGTLDLRFFNNTVQSAPNVRLRQGFDRIKCSDGSYQLEKTSIRFQVNVAGTTSSGNYGDVSIPEGNLYFALPIFMAGSSGFRLSSKPGTITIRQNGWNTGWYRQESRILGTFRVKPLGEAKQDDGF
jgi:hypothetical protein